MVLWSAVELWKKESRGIPSSKLFDNQLCIWDAESGKQKAEVHWDRTQIELTAHFSPRADIIILKWFSRLGEIRKVPTGELINTCSGPGICFSPDGTLFATYPPD